MAGTIQTNSLVCFTDCGVLISEDGTTDRLKLYGAAGVDLDYYSGSAVVRGLVLTNAGNVGIGTASPGARLQVNGTPLDRANGFDEIVQIHDDTTAAQGVGGGIGFSGLADVGVSPAGRLFSAIQGGHESATTTDYAGYLRFLTRASAAGTLTERLRISSTGNVGIGTTSPGGTLELKYAGNAAINTSDILKLNVSGGAANFGSIQLTDNTTYSSWINFNNNRLSFSGPGAGESLVINSSGNVGIGTTNPGAQLDLSTDSARKLTTNTWTTGSDIRIKTDVQNIDNALEIIRQIRPVQFHYNSDFLAQHPGVKDTTYYNFIAQEYQQVFPDSVTEIDGLLYLNPSSMIPFAIAAIKEQQTQIGDLTTGNLQLTTDLDVQTQNLASLQLKTDENISTLSDLKISTDKNLAIISQNINDLVSADKDLKDQLAGLRSLTSKFNFEDHETRIKYIEDLTVALQTQIDELKKITNIELIAANLEQDKTDIDYLKLLLGVDRVKDTGSINLLGSLEASEVVAGVFTVKVTDEAAKTLGQAKIEAGKTEINVKTKAVTENSRIFVTPGEPVKIGVTKIEAGEGFKIEIDEALDKDLKVDWWVVEEKQ